MGYKWICLNFSNEKIYGQIHAFSFIRFNSLLILHLNRYFLLDWQTILSTIVMAFIMTTLSVHQMIRTWKKVVIRDIKFIMQSLFVYWWLFSSFYKGINHLVKLILMRILLNSNIIWITGCNLYALSWPFSTRRISVK